MAHVCHQQSRRTAQTIPVQAYLSDLPDLRLCFRKTVFLNWRVIRTAILRRENRHLDHILCCRSAFSSRACSTSFCKAARFSLFHAAFLTRESGSSALPPAVSPPMASISSDRAWLADLYCASKVSSWLTRVTCASYAREPSSLLVAVA